uniref:Chloride channel protein n=1 Tax=Timema poppense TaxID=170557 RepID=A0A7R9CK21_TIMPO|nr:unnamed protein product [Timema poppensis]
MGCIGGLMGSLFNHINYKLTVFRMRYIRRKWLKVLEAALVAAIAAIFGFIMMVFINDCKPLDKDPTRFPIQMHCSDGDYSAVAAIWFQTPESSVKSLFHDPPGSHKFISLGIFFLLYFLLSVCTYGLSVSGGLFIPAILTGAAWGRLAGMSLTTMLPNSWPQHHALKMTRLPMTGRSGFESRPNVLREVSPKTDFHYSSMQMRTWVDPGKYALVGAAAQLGGTVRMTISLTVILIEATGNITFAFPLMLSLIMAKWTGDIFNEGIYDIHIKLSQVPILQWEPPPLSNKIYASEVMNHPVVVLKTVENVGIIVDILKATPHNGFPVVDPCTERKTCKSVKSFNPFADIDECYSPWIYNTTGTLTSVTRGICPSTYFDVSFSPCYFNTMILFRSSSMNVQ